eukprot:5128688-Prymnesium_polylepis.2
MPASNVRQSVATLRPLALVGSALPRSAPVAAALRPKHAYRRKKCGVADLLRAMHRRLCRS